MEKRWCERMPLAAHVMIHHNGHVLVKCAVNNLSLCGMSLNTGSLAFQRNTQIKIKFLDADNPHGDQEDCINAIVVRNSHAEIGLMFDPTEPETLNSILKRYKKLRRAWRRTED